MEMKDRKLLLYGIELKYFIPIAIIIFIAAYLNCLPKGIIGALSFMIVLGSILELIGDKTPIIKDYLGGGATLAIFGSAALVYINIQFNYNFLPKEIFDNITAFMNSGGFLDFYIAALIVGSILGMSRELLIKAALRYLPVIVGGVFLAVMFTGITGMLLGYGFKQAIFYIAIPIMGGGMGAGAVPLSKIFAQKLNVSSQQLLSVMVPAVTLGNAMAIVFGAMLDRLGKQIPTFSGNGNLLRNNKLEQIVQETEDNKLEIKDFGCGLLIALVFFVFGKLLSLIIPLHPYALMIISVAIVKLIGCINNKYERFAAKWYQFVTKNFTSALLIGIGIAYTDLGEIIKACNLTYILLVFTTILGAIVGTAIMGHLLGFYMIEASITAGLCMANMGGTGDVAVLSGANRMELMPFAQISSRIGGAFMLLLTSVLISFL